MVTRWARIQVPDPSRSPPACVLSTPPPLAKDWSGVTVERSAEPGPPGQLRVLCGLGRTSAAKPATLRSSVWDLRFYLPLKRPLIPPTGPPPPFSTHRPRPPHALYTRRAPSSVTLLPPSAVQPKRGLGQALGLQGHAVGSTHFHRSPHFRMSEVPPLTPRAPHGVRTSATTSPPRDDAGAWT